MKTTDRDITIFVVDDERLLLDSLLPYLEDLGFTAVGFSDPDEALQRFGSETPDICLVDLRLPGRLNGAELIKEIKKTAPGVHCFIYTGSLYAIPDDLKAIGMTQDDIIKKPIIDFEQFKEKLKRCCT
jgi:DNA-binding NtrC family response regulator